MKNPFICKECGHVEDFGVASSKSKWSKELRCMVTYNPETGEWLPPKEKKCSKCGSLNLEKDLTKVNIDIYGELRDPNSPRFWKKGKTAEELTKVYENDNSNPY